MKDADSKKAAEGLKNPNFSPSGESQPIEDKDFTEKTNDISKDAKVTLGSFLSGKSSVNSYRIVAGSTEAKLKTRGPEAALSNPEENEQQVFTNNSMAKMTLQSYGLGVKTAKEKVENRTQHTFFTEQQLKEILSKTSSGDPFLSGHNLLKSVPTETQSPVSKNDPKSPAPASIGPENLAPKGLILLQKVHEQLKEGNMYHPDVGAPFFQNPGNTNEEIATRGLFSIQRNLGSFDINGKRVQVSDMSATAMALLLRAVGNNAGSDQVLENKSLGIAAATALTAFVRPEQFGAVGNGIDVYRLRTVTAEGILFTINADEGAGPAAATATGQDDFGIKLMSDGNFLSRGSPPNNNELPNLQSSPYNKSSFSQLNSFLEPFGSKFSSLGMYIFGTASVLAILGAAIIVQNITSLSDTKRIKHSSNRPTSMTLGRRKSKDSTDFKEVMFDILEITDTDYDFSDCVAAGIPLMYGLPDSGTTTKEAFSSPESLKAIALNLVLTPAYYANFTRRLIAETTTIVNAFSNVASTSAVQGFDNFLKAIETIVNSALYKFIMISAGVGDASLKARFGPSDLAPDERYLPRNVSSSVFPQYNDLASDLEKSGKLGVYRKQTTRWLDGTNSLSLKTFLASQKYGPASVNDNTNKFNRGISPSVENVRKIENAIESEYMPFSIHDLRTNELMSLPAFITEFGESFNASYGSVEGIGRQDPVRLYQKTERQVTFGFMLVSFSKDDHDHMWWTINKLISMCYPQYSAGRIRTVKNADGKDIQFIQPFSQVQAASPMVRLRLADVFKSNYSKYGLARLFGIDTTILQKSGDNAAKIKETEDKLKKAKEDANLKALQIFSKIDQTKDTDVKNLIGTEVRISAGKKEFVQADGRSFSPPVIISDMLNVTVSDVTKVTMSEKVGKRIQKTPVILLKVKSADIATAKKQIEIKGSNEANNSNVINSLTSSGAYIDVQYAGQFSYDYLDKLVAADSDVISAQNELNNLKVSYPNVDFFKSETSQQGGGNAIVRSFETTRGRGVAGFITSLGLDYGMGSTPWVIEPGSKAPMIVKISLGFTPITDLPLGLDYDGYIRNPSHPVGEIAGAYGDPYYDLKVTKDANGKPTGNELKPMSRNDVIGEIQRANDSLTAESDIRTKIFKDSGP